MTFPRLCLALLLSLLPAAALAQDAEVTAALTAIAEEQIEPDAPGLAVGVVKDGEVIFEYYGGLANLSYDVAVGPETRFNIASNAKQFTALAVLQMVEAGEVSLDADIRTYVPEVLPLIDETITVEQLITHTSGLRDAYDLWSLQGVTWWQEFVGNDDALALLAAQRELNFAPGTQYAYSNSNYILLATLVETLGDDRFRNITGEMFDGMGMESTRFVRRYGAVIPNQAQPYGNFGWWFAYPSVTELYGDGFLFTTLPDQLSYEQMLQAGEADWITVSQSPLPGAASEDYGYGLEFGTYKGVPYRFHFGSTGAFNAALFRFDEPDLSIIAMSNNGNISPANVVRQMADLLLSGQLSEETYPPRPEVSGPRPDMADVTGLYQGISGTYIRITERDGALFREIDGRDPTELIHEEGNVFVYATNPDLRIAFEDGPGGPLTPVIYFPGQIPNPLMPVTPAPDTDVYRARLTGLFYNAELDVSFDIRTGDDGALTARRGEREFDVTSTGFGTLTIGGYTLSADMNADDETPVQTWLLEGERISNVRFERLE